MKLSEFLQNMALGELSGSSIVELDTFKILPTHRPRVIHALNQGLDYFYSTFPLKTNQLIIKLQKGLSKYYLDKDYSIFGSSQSTGDFPKYIMDSASKPYQDDFLQVEHVFTDIGHELAIDDPFMPMSVEVSEYNCLTPSSSVLNQCKYLVVIYRAKHPKIPLNITGSSDPTIVIPSSLEQALQCYVASQIYMNLSGVENKQLAQNLFAKYKGNVEELKLQGMFTKPQTGINIKPLLREWI